jgi:hypothetical protein
MRSPRSLVAASSLVALLLGGCETDFAMVAPEVRASAQRLGPAHGESYRHILFVTPTYNICPIGWGGCVDRAYAEALGTVPGATALADVTVEEDWFWWGLGSARNLNIDGTAVRK